MLFHLVYRFCATGATVRYRPNCGHKLDGGSTDLTDRLKAKGSAQCLIAAASGRPRIVGIRLIFIAPHPEDQHTREGVDSVSTPSLTACHSPNFCGCARLLPPHRGALNLPLGFRPAGDVDESFPRRVSDD